jgi:hypothetical protein
MENQLLRKDSNATRLGTESNLEKASAITSSGAIQIAFAALRSGIRNNGKYGIRS